MIEPTIGRKVWYTEGPGDREMIRMDNNQPFDATVVFVWHERMVNLLVVDHIGNQWKRSSVQLLQDDDAMPDNEAYCMWMPYQKGQAAKTEQLLGQQMGAGQGTMPEISQENPAPNIK